MNLIHHVLDIQAPPETVFTSITTADGLSHWWTTKVQADSAELGSLFPLTFRGPFNPQLRITEIESPSRVTWEGVSGHDAWGATTIRF
ncbi:MAG: SRPBCC family protein [Acidimicrobiales bacterium]